MQCNDRLGWAEACAVQRHSRCTTSIYFYMILGRGCTFVILCMMRPTATASSDIKPHRHHSEFSTSPTLPLLCGQCRGSVEAPRLHAELLILPAHLCTCARLRLLFRPRSAIATGASRQGQASWLRFPPEQHWLIYYVRALPILAATLYSIAGAGACIAHRHRTKNLLPCC